MEETQTIAATPEQWRQIYRVLVDPEVQRVAGKMFAIPDVAHLAQEIVRLNPDLE